MVRKLNEADGHGRYYYAESRASSLVYEFVSSLSVGSKM
jgi:hypothetical protein